MPGRCHTTFHQPCDCLRLSGRSILGCHVLVGQATSALGCQCAWTGRACEGKQTPSHALLGALIMDEVKQMNPAC